RNDAATTFPPRPITVADARRTRVAEVAGVRVLLAARLEHLMVRRGFRVVRRSGALPLVPHGLRIAFRFFNVFAPAALLDAERGVEVFQARVVAHASPVSWLGCHRAKRRSVPRVSAHVLPGPA